MRVSRDITLVIHYLLDNFCPPILRDCKWFMYPIMKLGCGGGGGAVEKYFEFKDRFPFMSEEELSDYYQQSAVDEPEQRPSDLNSGCLEYIKQNVVGNTLLDAACGRGGCLQELHRIYPHICYTGTDIAPNPASEKFNTIKASLYSLPFEARSFDTVLCTHTLEHLRNPQEALRELIRVTRQRLIIVVPKQRQYLYTPDLHVQFLPYMYSFKIFIGIKNAEYLEIKGDFVCRIDMP